MPNPYRNQHDDLDDLLQQVDDLLQPPQSYDDYNNYDNYDSGDDPYGYDDDIDDFDDMVTDDTILYQNFSNNYGANVQNFANGYGGRQAPPTNPAPAAPSIPAYNADFRQQPRREPADAGRTPRRDSMGQKAARRNQGNPYADDPIPPVYRKPSKPKRRRGCGCGCSTVLVMLAVLVAGIFGLIHFMFQPPKSDDSIGARKKDTATILLCGVDADGTRTDTMMLMYLSGSEHKVGLLSIPRDTYILTSGGNEVKLNAAYGLNNCGEEGMEGLFDHIQRLIGYRPDGYLLVDFELVPKITDLMGGLEVDVPMDCEDNGISLNAGLQTLNGDELLMLLRHRKSYALADLTRVEVQRQVIKACMEQWVSPGKIGNAMSVLDLVENNSLTTLTTPNYLWIAKTILMNLKNFSTDTLPGEATTIDGISYYLLDPESVADLINESYNPYQVHISTDDLDIAG